MCKNSNGANRVSLGTSYAFSHAHVYDDAFSVYLKMALDANLARQTDPTFAEVCSSSPRPNAETSTDTEAWEYPEAAMWTPRWYLADAACASVGNETDV